MSQVRAPFVSAFLAVLLLIRQPASAEIGDPTLRTDHPQYAGEGAFQSIEGCVRFATEGHHSSQDKAIAMYLWLLTHQWHLASPQEFAVPGSPPDTKRTNAYEMMVFDANRARFSYGYGLCGTVHAWNEPYWKALGMNARRRAFPGHVNSEIEYDGWWHAFDTDMAGLLFRPDGAVAGYDDIVRNPEIATQRRPPLPCYPFAWPADFKTMEAGWRQVANGGHWYKMYHSGYAAHPGVVHLRSGETFTRYFDRDHFGGPTKRRFWHHQLGGPFRDWTFANRGTPKHEDEKSNSRGNASYCNGEFVYRPHLADETFREGTVAVSSNLVSRTGSPRLRSGDGKSAFVTFGHFSPYVICGDPVDDANPMTGEATGGLVIKGVAVGRVRLSVSSDEGQSWQSIGELIGAFKEDLTEFVKGRYGWQTRIDWSEGAGLDDLEFTTVTQVCQAIYPRLKPGGCETTYRAASRAVVRVLPNWALSEDAIAFEEKSLRSNNVSYSPRSESSRFAYKTNNDKPGIVAFVIDSPTDLAEISAAARFAVTVPPPANCDFHMDYSLDRGQTWLLLANASVPSDNEYSTGWMYGRAAVNLPGVRKALVRVHFYNGGQASGLIDAQLYGLRETQLPEAATLTYAWKENGQLHQWIDHTAAGLSEHRFLIPTGEQLTDEFVRMAVQ